MIVFTMVRNTQFYDNYVNDPKIVDKINKENNTYSDELNFFDDKKNREALEGVAALEQERDARHNRIYMFSFAFEMILFIMAAVMVASWTTENIPAGLSTVLLGTIITGFIFAQLQAHKVVGGFYTAISQTNLKLAHNDFKAQNNHDQDTWEDHDRKKKPETPPEPDSPSFGGGTATIDEDSDSEDDNENNAGTDLENSFSRWEKQFETGSDEDEEDRLRAQGSRGVLSPFFDRIGDGIRKIREDIRKSFKANKKDNEEDGDKES